LSARLEVEVLGVGPEAALTVAEAELLAAIAAAAGDVHEGHLAIAFVDEDKMRELNREYRGRDAPTDVLSFPIDEDGEAVGPRELGDVVICPAHTENLRETVVHGVLHLVGMDHETDDGEMLAVQAEIMRWADQDWTQ
jgi:probable rRNA maturation factor